MLGDDDEWLSSDGQRDAVELTHEFAPEPGSVLADGYRIVRLLGKGSMGAVFLAHDEALDRRVAIKFTHPNLLGPTFRKRFLDEARAMARVSHPNVLQVYAFRDQHEA